MLSPIFWWECLIETPESVWVPFPLVDLLEPSAGVLAVSSPLLDPAKICPVQDCIRTDRPFLHFTAVVPPSSKFNVIVTFPQGEEILNLMRGADFWSCQSVIYLYKPLLSVTPRDELYALHNDNYSSILCACTLVVCDSKWSSDCSSIQGALKIHLSGYSAV